jgi:hypothetical protein
MAIVIPDVAADGVFQFVDRSEDTAPDAPSGDGGEEAFDGIEPGCRCRREVEHPARVIGQLPPDLGMLMSGVIVEDGMDYLADGHGALHRVEEFDEFLMSVLVHAMAEHGAVEHIEGGEQSRNACLISTSEIRRGGAVALVIMGHSGTFISGDFRKAKALRATSAHDRVAHLPGFNGRPG